MQFEFDKKEAVLKAEHEAEIARQRVIRNATIGGGAVLLFAALTSFAFYKKRRDADVQRKEAEFHAQVADTEMKALRSQVNPHFIFNSLNSIGDYVSKHNMGAADYFLTKFAKLMRLILENSEKKEVTLADDLHALELYLELEATRFNKKFTYDIVVDGAIDPGTTLIPPLLLQPFVENSILHGIANKMGDGKILIRIAKEDQMIRCIVEDNGVGRKQSVPSEQKKQSLGIKITKARIDILNRIKQSNAKVELSDLAEGTRVEVSLPLVVQF
jgi:LytS/YehU family sensor histidine kinase